MRHISKREFKSSSHLYKGSILWLLWVIFEENKSILQVIIQKFLWVVFENERFNSVSHIGKEGSILRVKLKKRVQCFESYSILWVKLKKKKKKTSVPLILWVVLTKERFNSLNHTYKVQSFWVTFSKKRESSILWVTLEKIQFFESYSRKVIIFKKVQFFASFFKKVQFIVTWSKRGFNSSSHIV